MRWELPVDVELTVVWQIIVDNQRDLLNVQTSSPYISGNQNTTAYKEENNEVVIFNTTSEVAFQKIVRNYCEM